MFDLKENQAVKLENGSYFVGKVPSYFSKPFYVENDGQLTPLPNSNFTVDDLTKIKIKKSPAKVLTHYENDEGIKKTVDEYNRRNVQWLDYLDEDYYPESFHCDDLEVEKKWVEHKYYWNGFKPVYEEQPETIEDVEITVVGTYQDTGSDFIQSALSIGKVSFAPYNGLYKVTLLAVAMDEYNKFVAENAEYIKEHSIKMELPTHSGLKFLQVDNAYIFTNCGVEAIEKPTVKVVTDLEQAKELETNMRRFVRTRLNTALFKEKISKEDKMHIICEVERIQDKVRSLSVYSRASGDKSAALTLINKLLEDLR